MVKHISSFQNPLIKKIQILQKKSKERKHSKLFIIEGKREISLALKGNYILETLLFNENIISEKQIFKNFDFQNNIPKIISISNEIYEKLSYRNSTEGVIAISKMQNLELSSLNLNTKNPLILIAEAPEKPGNIGAILRTADAANLDAVIIANPKTDLYNPNIIRNSIGCLFTNRVATGSTEDIIRFLNQKSISIFCAALQASVSYHTIDFTKSAAIVVGTEADGLSTLWLKNSTQNIIIPMSGEIDSMNVSVAAGIIIFEAKKQRGF